MSLDAGTVFLDVRPDTTRFSSSLQSNVTKSSGKLKGVLGKVGGTLGLAMGAGAAIAFGKSALANAEAAIKSQNLFTEALKNSHQAGLINAQSFNSWLEEFAIGIGKDDDELRNLSTHLANAFDFRKFGPNATAVLESMTQGILDMSAATGKPQKMLEKLFLTIGNDPAGALTQLQKLGVITDAQSEHFKKMADAGKLAEVSQALLTATNEKYGGTAAKSTTASEKLGAIWGEFSETVGNGLLPIFSSFAGVLGKVLGWVTGLSPSTKKIAAIIGGSLVGALVAWKVAMIGVNIATAANPVGFIVAAVAVAAGLIIANWGKVKSFVLNMWDAIKTKVGAVLGFLKTVANAVFLPLRTLWNGLAAIWNSSIGAINFHVPGTSFTFDVPDLPSIPALAEGGIVKRPGLAFVHAAEVITPMDRLDGLGGLDMGRRRGPVEVYLVNPHDIGNDSENIQHDRRMGRARRGT